MHSMSQQSPMAIASAIMERAHSSPETDNGILVGTVIPLQPDEAAGGVEGGRSWAKAVASVCFCFSGLFFAFAALAVVRHYGHLHLLHRVPDFLRHFHGHPKLLVIVFSVAMLCGAAGLVCKFMKARQPSLAMGVEHSLQRSKCAKAGASVCLVLGVLVISFAIVVLSGARKLHRMHLFHSVRPHTLHVSSIVCLVIGVVLVATSAMLLKRLTSFRTVVVGEAPQSDDQSLQRSRSSKAAAFVCCGLGLLAISFAIVVLAGGHTLLHHTHFGHSVSHHTLHVISLVSLVIGAASIAASLLLFKKTTTSRTLLGGWVVTSQSSTSKRRALIVMSIVLGLLLIAGALHAAHRHLHMPVHFPWSHHHAHGTHHYNEHWTKQGSGSESPADDEDGDDEAGDDGDEAVADDQGERRQDKDAYEAGEDEEGEGGEGKQGGEEGEEDEEGEEAEGEQREVQVKKLANWMEVTDGWTSQDFPQQMRADNVQPVMV